MRPDRRASAILIFGCSEPLRKLVMENLGSPQLEYEGRTESGRVMASVLIDPQDLRGTHFVDSAGVLHPVERATATFANGQVLSGYINKYSK